MTESEESGKSPIQDFASKLLIARSNEGWGHRIDVIPSSGKSSVTITSECISALLAARCHLSIETQSEIDQAVSGALSWLLDELDKPKRKQLGPGLSLDNLARTVEALDLSASFPALGVGGNHAFRVRKTIDSVNTIQGDAVGDFFEKDFIVSATNSFHANTVCAKWMADIMFSAAANLCRRLGLADASYSNLAKSLEAKQAINLAELKGCLSSTVDADNDFLICFSLYFAAAVHPGNTYAFSSLRALCGNPMILETLRAVEAQDGRVKAFFPPVMLIALKALHRVTFFRPATDVYRVILRDLFLNKIVRDSEKLPYILNQSNNKSETRTFAWAHHLKALAELWPGDRHISEVLNDKGVRLTKKIVVSIDIASSSWVLEQLTLSGRVKLWLDLLKLMRTNLGKIGDEFIGLGRVTIYKFTGDGWIVLIDDDASWKSIEQFLFKIFKNFKEIFSECVEKSLDAGNADARVVKIRFGMESGLIAFLRVGSVAEYVGRAINMACRLEGLTIEKEGSSLKEKGIEVSREVDSDFAAQSVKPYVVMSSGLYAELTPDEGAVVKAESVCLKNMGGENTKVIFVGLTGDGQNGE